MIAPYERLGDVAEINPRSRPANSIADETLCSFVPMAAIDELDGRITAPETRAYATVKKGFTAFHENDVLFAKITPCMQNGKAAIARDLVGGCGFGSTEFHVLRARERVIPEWLFYFVRREEFRQAAKKAFTGSAGQQRVPAQFLGAASIPIPPLPEQRRIVDVLARAEGLVRLQREAVAKTREITPALFLDMFGDPATLATRWPVHALSSVAVIYSGITKGRKLNGESVIHAPYLRVANVKDGFLDLAEIKTIDLLESELPRYLVKPGDLLMTEGGDADKLGRAALWSGEVNGCVHQNHIFRVRCDPHFLLPVYALELIGSNYGKSYFLQVAKRTTGIASINKTQLSAFPMIAPPLALQTRFAEYVARIRGVQRQAESALAKAQAAFQALLYRAFAVDGSAGNR